LDASERRPRLRIGLAAVFDLVRREGPASPERPSVIALGAVFGFHDLAMAIAIPQSGPTFGETMVTVVRGLAGRPARPGIVADARPRGGRFAAFAGA
jgi:hypothetical protein